MHIKLEQVEGECCQHVQRLLIVRRDLLHKMQNPPAEMMTDHGDLYSETGSSFFTHSTGTGTSSKRSSKNKRKHERKKLRLKEGSPFEDLAIIHELYVLYNSINGVLGKILQLKYLLLNWLLNKKLFLDFYRRCWARIEGRFVNL